MEMAMVMGAGDCDGDDGGGGDDGGDAGDGDAKEEALTGMLMGLAMGKMMVMVNGCVLIPTFTLYLYKYTCKTNEENYIIYI